MAVNHELYTPFKTSELDADELQTGLVEHVAYVVASASEAQSLDLTGIAVPALVLGVTLFAYDASDTVTAHDGTTCLVTSDGKRFKSDGTRVSGWNGYTVKDDDLTAPPGSETVGYAYLLPASPTGDWSAYGKHVAIYTERGYVYIAPREGMLVYVSDEDIYKRYNGTTWVAGFGSSAIADGSLKAAKLEQAYGWRVESETATPPGSVPAEGTLYIVGASATGAWAGEDGNIARSTGSAWEFIDAAEGMQLFNKATDEFVTFKSGAWGVVFIPGLLVWQGPAVVDTDGGTASSGSGQTTILDLDSRATLADANKIRITFFINALVDGGANSEIGVYIDSGVAPEDEVLLDFSTASAAMYEFEVEPGDTQSRQYFIKIERPGSGSITWNYAFASMQEISG